MLTPAAGQAKFRASPADTADRTRLRCISDWTQEVQHEISAQC